MQSGDFTHTHRRSSNQFMYNFKVINSKGEVMKNWSPSYYLTTVSRNDPTILNLYTSIKQFTKSPKVFWHELTNVDIQGRGPILQQAVPPDKWGEVKLHHNNIYNFEYTQHRVKEVPEEPNLFMPMPTLRRQGGCHVK